MSQTSSYITASGRDPVKVGQVRNIPVDLSSPIQVTCFVLEQRKVYGRYEYLVGPIEGEGAAWVREDRIVPENK